MKKFAHSFIFKQISAIIIGLLVGLAANESVIAVIITIRQLVSQLIFFCVPLIILSFITPSIASLRGSSSKVLFKAFGIAFLCAFGAQFFSLFFARLIIPMMNINYNPAELKPLPDVIFNLSIPPVMGVFSALVLAILCGIVMASANVPKMNRLFLEFKDMVSAIIRRTVMPVIPIFIGTTFAQFAYTGAIEKQLPQFAILLACCVALHYVWLFILYAAAGIMSRKNPLRILKNYLPAFTTAFGTMSSSATLPVTISCVEKSGILPKNLVDFSVPIFTSIHFPGSVITEMILAQAVLKMLNGELPPMHSLLMFIMLASVFGLAAAGVPGGIIMATIGILETVLGFDAAGIALLMGIFMLQDCFSTSTNVLSVGALSLMLSAFSGKDFKEE